MNTRRIPQLDLLRAAAITAVVVYHVVQMSPVSQPAAMQWARYGQYGVDLFFVLSGWLIGGLYWREIHAHGDVAIQRFWLRRALRTVPPYLAALVVAWLAVYAANRRPFDAGFLVFAQNYYGNFPYFLVSWSLCVEEHFYAVVPLVVSLVASRRRWLPVLFVLLILAPLGFRAGEVPSGDPPGWSYYCTATHLRTEGLLLGFALAYVPQGAPALWAVAAHLRSIWLFSAVVLLSLPVALPAGPMYRWGFTAISFGFAALLVGLQFKAPGPVARSGSVYAIAMASYSVYLTHTFCIHMTRLIVAKAIPSQWWPVYYPLALALIAVIGSLFYLCVERPSIRLRDRWVPPRHSVPSIPLAPAEAVTGIS